MITFFHMYIIIQCIHKKCISKEFQQKCVCITLLVLDKEYDPEVRC